MSRRRNPLRRHVRRPGRRRRPIDKIISGGQTGVDRAALDVALERGIPCGGWCPRGRRAEDGVVPERYPVVETPSPRYMQRTDWNVRDSDATLALVRRRPAGGTWATVRLAARHGRPWRVIVLDERTRPGGIVAWLRINRVRVLNVAGPRESERPGIYDRARALLLAVFSDPFP